MMTSQYPAGLCETPAIPLATIFDEATGRILRARAGEPRTLQARHVIEVAGMRLFGKLALITHRHGYRMGSSSAAQGLTPRGSKRRKPRWLTALSAKAEGHASPHTT